jgi:hypothetical protein
MIAFPSLTFIISPALLLALLVAELIPEKIRNKN